MPLRTFWWAWLGALDPPRVIMSSLSFETSSCWIRNSSKHSRCAFLTLESLSQRWERVLGFILGSVPACKIEMLLGGQLHMHINLLQLSKGIEEPIGLKINSWVIIWLLSNTALLEHLLGLHSFHKWSLSWRTEVQVFLLGEQQLWALVFQISLRISICGPSKHVIWLILFAHLLQRVVKVVEGVLSWCLSESTLLSHWDFSKSSVHHLWLVVRSTARCFSTYYKTSVRLPLALRTSLLNPE